MTDEAETHEAGPDRPPAPDIRTAVLGGGCFWCLEAVFQRIEGVAEVTSGYAGGHEPEPTFRQVCTGTTGHAEVVRIRFDPEELPYDEMLRIFFTIHDPTTPDRQGADVGPQYRSIILYDSPGQEEAARRVIREIEEDGPWEDPVVTQVEPLEAFHPAEPEHHDYYDRNREQPYCQVVVAPKVAKARKAFAHRFRA
jgi:peptide-methionine (S)-S-oxide reductase